MGRRTTSATKGGRYMNPADQERKQNRKRELKKNKKQRFMVRQAVLKSKDPHDILAQMRKLDQMEFDPNFPPPLPERVIQEKRQKLRETYFRVLDLYKKESENDKYEECKKQLMDYDGERVQVEQTYLAVKFAKEANPAEIPLPEGLMAPGAAFTPRPTLPFQPHAMLADYIAGHAVPGHGILKKAALAKAAKPPGPPVGPPEEFSDSDDEDEEEENSEEEEEEEEAEEGGEQENEEGEVEGAEEGERLSDDEEEEQEARERTKKSVRFNADEEEEGELEDKDSRTKYKDIAKRLAAGDVVLNETDKEPPPLLSMAVPVPVALRPPPFGGRFARPPPPPPGMPPRLMMTNRMPPPLPPSGLMPGASRMRAPDQIGPPGPSTEPTSAAVISAGPIVTKRAGPTIEAKPQLRNMQQELTKLVPTALKVKRNASKKPSKPHSAEGAILSGVAVGGAAAAPKSTDDAYEQFMKEMSGIL